MEEKSNIIGYSVLALIGIIDIVLLVLFFIQGTVWLETYVFPVCVNIFWPVLFVSVFILFPLCLIKKTRVIGGIGLLVCSYIFGGIAWIFAVGLLWNTWGLAAVIVGLIFAVIGIVPIAFIAALLNGVWASVLILVVLAGCWFGAKVLSGHAVIKYDEEHAYIDVENNVEL